MLYITSIAFQNLIEATDGGLSTGRKVLQPSYSKDCQTSAFPRDLSLFAQIVQQPAGLRTCRLIPTWFGFPDLLPVPP